MAALSGLGGFVGVVGGGGEGGGRHLQLQYKQDSFGRQGNDKDNGMLLKTLGNS